MKINEDLFDFGAPSLIDFQVSYRFIPVVGFPGTLARLQTLKLVLQHYGRVQLGFVAKETVSGNYSMFEMDCVIIP